MSPKEARHLSEDQAFEYLLKNSAVTERGCWEWVGGRSKSGYGACNRNVGGHRESLIHRWSWYIHNGPIPDGMWVLHHCDNPPCCNPDHLFLGTQLDNLKDMINKGRDTKARGSKIGLSKLKEMDVVEIKTLIKSGVKCREIAIKFGVSKRTINYISQGKSWRHVVCG